MCINWHSAYYGKSLADLDLNLFWEPQDLQVVQF